MNILILGGTGVMGIHLIEILQQTKTNNIYVTTRTKKQSSDNVNYIEGNAKDISFMKKLISGEQYDVIVDFMSYSTEEFSERYNALLNATKQYIFLSSSRVYSNNDTIITEETDRLLDVSTDEMFLKTDDYSLAKARQENLLLNSSHKNYTIVRPYITYSHNRLQLGIFEKEQWLYRALKGKTIVFFSDIAKKLTTLTYGFDVSYIISKLIGNEKAYGEVFHITNSESMMWGDILLIYKEMLEEKLKRPIRIKMLSNTSNIKNNNYQLKYDRLYDRQFSSDKVNAMVGEKIYEYTNLKVGIRKSIDEFIKNGNHFLDIDWRIEAILDRICGERTKLAEINSVKRKIKYLIYRYMPFVKRI